MKLFTPIRKVAFGLVMLTVSILMLGEVLGILPNEQRAFLQGRRILCESMAVQFSRALGQGEIELVRATLADLVERDAAVLSATVESSTGQPLLTVGRHAEHWQEVLPNQSSATHVQVPIFKDNKPWASLQVAFAALPTSSVPYSFGYPLLPFFLYMTGACFVGFLWFVRRTLKELDPSSVIPERVKSAFDTLAEGLVIMDEKENIILANSAFSEKIEAKSADLIGRSISSIGWDNGTAELPWKAVLADNRRHTGAVIRFHLGKDSARTFTVNATPIADSQGKVRGALTTFNDLTDLERKQLELKQTVGALQQSRRDLQEKAVELEILATRDPLTNLLNRRAFFEKADFLFSHAVQSDLPLACIMTDIDHFKAVNDNHGHAMGDEVIKLVAGELRNNGRPDDVIARYGGEEFCIVLPGIELAAVVAIAERLRINIEDGARRNFDNKLRVTSSFGVAMLEPPVKDAAELIALADKALYLAKDGGRNRVVAWSGEASEPAVTTAAPSVADPDPHTAETVGSTSDSSLRERIVELENKLVVSEQAHSDQISQDPITGLPNRMLLIDRIRQVTAHSERFGRIAAVIVMDIDLFRRINDALGFVVGDKVLRKAGERLNEILRETDTVAMLGSNTDAATVSRTGADEFGILLSELENPEAATWIVKRLLDNMSKPLEIDGNEIIISCSAGVSLFPLDTADPEQLLGYASAARYNAKQKLGRNNFAYFSESLNRTSSQHLWLEGQIHNALENGEFALHYQPKVDLTSGLITSMEALLRWDNPKIGMVSPVDFIPVAEHAGLINDIGRWVIETGCAQARSWTEAGFPNIAIAVNVSALQFRQDDMFEHIVSTLADTALEPGILELEVTESAVMENFEESIETLKRLAEFGVHVAIDDFGTGYSSLAYLKHMPVNTLKIDRSFLSDTVPDEQDKQIIAAIIAMAHSMKLKVVAEGVETDTQRSLLRNLQCDEMQGYLFSKPVTGDESLELLRRNSSAGTGPTLARKIA